MLNKWQLRIIEIYIMLKKKNNCFKQQNKEQRNRTKSKGHCQTYSLSGTSISSQMVDQLCIIFVSRFDLYAAKIHFVTVLLGCYPAQMAADHQPNVQTSCLYSETFNFLETAVAMELCKTIILRSNCSVQRKCF